MKTLANSLLIVAAVLFSTATIAQSESLSDDEELKIAALEALIAAPPERAMPIASKVLAGNHSNEVKERALFILSQIETAEAQETLLRFAREENGELQAEAIRMIGIGGDADAMASLGEIYASGDREAREAVLEAYLIANDKRAVFEIAANAENKEDFEDAVDMLGAMGARDELRELRSRAGVSDALIDAYAISGDFDSLRELAMDDSDADLQTQAIEALGIVGGDQVESTLLEIYRNAASDDVREAALDGMMISGHDVGMLELYRASNDAAEKKELLEYLVMMGSDDVWNIIDSALDGDQ
ncbi:MAG: HEAT repeat domain-containing protein [Woeseiaceae bacterium]